MKILTWLNDLRQSMQYRIWLIFGGRRTQEIVHDAFRHLSKDVLENRKRVNQLRIDLRELEQKVWDLKEHTPEEDIERLQGKLSTFGEELKEFGSSWLFDTPDDDNAHNYQEFREHRLRDPADLDRINAALSESAAEAS